MALYVLYAMYIHSTPSRSGWPQCSVTTRSARPGETIDMFESMCHAQAAHWIVVWHLLTCDNSGSSIVTLSSVILFKKWERSQLRGNCCFQMNILDLHFVHVQDVKPDGALRCFSLVRQSLVANSTEFFSGSPGPGGHRDTRLQERQLKSHTKMSSKDYGLAVFCLMHFWCLVNFCIHHC